MKDKDLENIQKSLEKNEKQEKHDNKNHEKHENKNHEKHENKNHEKIVKKYETEIEKLKLDLTNVNEKMLRNQAELVNFKRGKEEEVPHMMKYCNEDILKSLLPIIDNFERGLMMDDNDLSDEVSKFLSGFKMIYTDIIGIMNKNEVKEIEAEGIEFDPKVHQAVLMDHDEEKPHGVVLEVLQKGYMYKDKVIRPAMVKVNE